MKKIILATIIGATLLGCDNNTNSSSSSNSRSPMQVSSVTVDLAPILALDASSEISRAFGGFGDKFDLSGYRLCFIDDLMKEQGQTEMDCDTKVLQVAENRSQRGVELDAIEIRVYGNAEFLLISEEKFSDEEKDINNEIQLIGKATYNVTEANADAAVTITAENESFARISVSPHETLTLSAGNVILVDGSGAEQEYPLTEAYGTWYTYIKADNYQGPITVKVEYDLEDSTWTQSKSAQSVITQAEVGKSYEFRLDDTVIHNDDNAEDGLTLTESVICAENCSVTEANLGATTELSTSAKDAFEKLKADMLLVNGMPMIGADWLDGNGGMYITIYQDVPYAVFNLTTWYEQYQSVSSDDDSFIKLNAEYSDYVNKTEFVAIKRITSSAAQSMESTGIYTIEFDAIHVESVWVDGGTGCGCDDYYTTKDNPVVVSGSLLNSSSIIEESTQEFSIANDKIRNIGILLQALITK